MKKIAALSLLILLMTLMSNAMADCFIASGKALSDAQTIRKLASSMGWKVGKAASISAGAFIKGKAALYPQGSVEVCLRENKAGKFVFRVQSSSSDAGEAKWRTLLSKKTEANHFISCEADSSEECNAI